MSKHDTVEWKLDVVISYRLKNPRVQKTCPQCSGLKEVGHRTLGLLDGPQACPTCLGFGYIWDGEAPKTRPPEIPKELVDYLRKALKEYENN
jgi:hypothetical protein